MQNSLFDCEVKKKMVVFENKITVERLTYEPITITTSDKLMESTASLSVEKTKQLIEILNNAVNAKTYKEILHF